MSTMRRGPADSGMLFLIIFVSCSLWSVGNAASTAAYIASNLKIQLNIISNGADGELLSAMKLSLTNSGSQSIDADRSWAVYFCSIRLISPAVFSKDGNASLEVGKFTLRHVDGCLHELRPTAAFAFLPGSVEVLDMQAQFWTVSRTDVMPNWYVVAEDTSAAGGPSAVEVIDNTKGESLDFVGSFTEPQQYKRTSQDLFSPIRPDERYGYYEKVSGVDLPDVRYDVLPTPKSIMDKDISKVLTVDTSWTISRTGNTCSQNMAQLLAAATGLTLTNDCTAKCISFPIAQASASLKSITATERIEIGCWSEEGAFYAVQSFLALWERSKTIPQMTIIDSPRFQYRGFMIDIARNFRSAEEIRRLIPVLSKYKLNRLHLHLTDDEGWRLEIDGLPELTQVGAATCHDPTQVTCMLPQLGASPLSSAENKYLTRQDYIDIVKLAAKHHIEVVPEIDLPGHANAAIIAMKARFTNTGQGDFLLSDPKPDTSNYISVQNFRANAVNPCTTTTYAFVDKVMGTIKSYHTEAGAPLKLIHMGGDEVGKTAWINSTSCIESQQNQTLQPDREELMEKFLQGVVQLARKHDLDLGLWEDALFGRDRIPLTSFGNYTSRIYGYFWQNVWEWGGGQRAYLMAEAGYKVVLMPATHNYMDHPYEPDPEERGYYWATRYTGTNKTFGFRPDDIFSNVLTSVMGHPLKRSAACPCPTITPVVRANIIGYQGGVWSETVRTEDQLHQMIFPRMLAVAERAWHKAAWETTPVWDKPPAEAVDYARFAAIVGQYELPRLVANSVGFHLNAPGVRLNADGSPQFITEFPASAKASSVQMSTDGKMWSDVASFESLRCNTATGTMHHFRTSYAGQTSRSISMRCERMVSSSSSRVSEVSISLVKMSVCLLVYYRATV